MKFIFKASDRLYPWVVVFAATAFAFLINNATNFNVISIYLTTQLKLNTSEVGFLFACYFYTNILFVFFTGLILDKVPTKKILIISFIVANISILIFTLTNTIILMTLSRLLLGIVGSFSMLTTFKLIKTWFPVNKITLVTGIATTFANLGTFFSQIPLLIIVNKLGWRMGLLTNFWLSSLLLILALTLNYEPPQNKTNSIVDQNNTITKVITNGQNRIIGFYGSLVNLPILFFSASWGILYLQNIKNFSEMTSSSIISSFIVGTILGSFIIGWLADRFNIYKLLMYLCMQFAVICLIIIAAENNPPKLTNTATGFVATLTAISGLYIQLLSYIMNYYNTLENLANGYNISIWILIITVAINIFLILIVKKDGDKRRI
ncbi:MAG: MFS transporter [Coxiellaceae bacterium]|jgi:MFS family permease|nr:MFS transporter [Coxiellaceae bacterium]